MELAQRHWGLLIALLLASLILIPYSTVELGRDQANWLTIAMALENGSVLYRDVAFVNTPGLGVLYLIINKLFGNPEITPWVTHVLTILLTLIAGYAFARKIYGPNEAAWAVIVTALLWPLSMDWWEVGQKDLGAFTLALCSAAVLAWSGARRKHDIAAGALLALAILFKTTGVVYAAPLAVQLYFSSKSFKEFFSRGLWMAAGGIGMAALPLIYFLWHGALGNAWDSLVQRGSAYGGFNRMSPGIILYELSIFLFQSLGLVAVLPLFRLLSMKQDDRRFLPMGLFILTTIALVFLQGRAWFYHMVPFIAAWSLGAGICLGHVISHGKQWLRISSLAVFGITLVYTWGNMDLRWYKYANYMAGNVSYSEHQKLFEEHLALNMNWMAPHSESRQIGELIRNNTTPQDRIFVWGMESQIYVYADRMFIGPSFNDAPIWHPQLAEIKPDYFMEKRSLFFSALQETPPAYFVIARDDANPVEPIPSDISLFSMPEFARFIQDNYTPVMGTRYFIVLEHNQREPEAMPGT